MSSQQVDLGDYKYGFHYEDKSVFKTRKGLDAEDVVQLHQRGEKRAGVDA